MKRLVPGFAVLGAMLTLLPPPISSAANNTATTLFPLDGRNQLETYTLIDCHKATDSCDFTAGADMSTPDGVTGFPPGLWARQTTEFRLSSRLAYLDVHATGQFERVTKAQGSDVITTVYLGAGPPDKYQTSGIINSTDWSTGQPKTNVNVIDCTHIQVVYTGVNITSPSTCAQTTFS